MLKYNWTEHPDWKNPEHYAHLKAAKPQEWAWEFLRRNPEYREDWQKLDALKQDFGPKWVYQTNAVVYQPAKLDNEDEQAWMRRTVYDCEPRKTRLDEFLAHKWGLNVICNPEAPLPSQVHFLKPTDFPKMLLEPDDFFDLIDDVDEGDGPSLQLVKPEYAVIAVDLTHSLDEQLSGIERIIRRHRQKLLSSGAIKKAQGHAAKNNVWIRHVRVLDALRCTPRPTSLEIAQVLGCNGPGIEEMRKEGDRFIEQARKTLKNYRKVALFRNSSKIAP